ncbi:EscU/YscU/HrcU family type III secretion system export apparatus switch protein [Kineothrix sp. MB12-C1]|uniref:EscU/YscU/HrcU family type III secretion system export apparatus switch protein n=1 Tax=Kineothrix sp. MB12-C1 TaxID=3070215 RepID=UPI0027D1FE2D|nr:EscU/YscU/HrcU family type III secretion system export apparatus switch protein [Kineothrix sp. MB12-C1]WMC92668.1 EscU/YscU/HrcU family type III secretion system export apparatus switch protein [Kineothrix sp. MB12-C1]
MSPYEKSKKKTIVSEEKPKHAIALAYDPEEEAPRIIASGKGELGERIIERAKEADIPIHKDNKLADTLSRLEIGDMIPPQLYEVVAEILVFVDAMDKIKAKMDKEKH